MKKTLLIFTAVVLLFSAKAQKTETENPYFKKNSVTVNLVDATGGMAFNYEHYWDSPSTMNEVGLKVGYTSFSVATLYDETPEGSFVFGFIVVYPKKQHGLVLSFDIVPFSSDFTTAFNVAWKLQTKRGFVSKLGMGMAAVINNNKTNFHFLPTIGFGWSF